jgi:MFS family permease
MWSVVACAGIGLACGTSYAMLLQVVFNQYSQSLHAMIGGWCSTALALGGLFASFLADEEIMHLSSFMLMYAFAQAGCGFVGIKIIFNDRAEHSAQVSASVNESTSNSGATNDEATPLVAKSESLLEVYSKLVRQPTFWMTATAMFLTIGVGSAYTANMGTLINSVDGPIAIDRSANIVGLFNFWQSVGRMLGAILCGVMVAKKKDSVFPLSMVMAISFVICMFISAVYITPDNIKYIICGFGVPYGLMWNMVMTWNQFTSRPESNMWSIVMNYIVMPMGGLGALLFNIMVGFLYDTNADGVTHKCYYSDGTSCYFGAFMGLALASICVIPLLMFLQCARSERVKAVPSSDVAIASEDSVPEYG